LPSRDPLIDTVTEPLRGAEGALPLWAVAELLARLRNAEAAISGYCQLAEEAVISPGEALASVEQALTLLASARERIEVAVRAADGRAPERHDSARLGAVR
jgi:hypothetical protein